MTLKVLDLFSGIGGFSLGLERTNGFETVAFCEIEPFPRKVLAKHWQGVPIYEDVRLLDGDELQARHGRIDVICGGYPCQPFSTAGKRKGKDDDRHLWPEVNRLLVAIRPTWAIFENVAGHVSMGLDEVLADLENAGYSWWAGVIPACAVDAPHRRGRVWIVANSGGGRCGGSGQGEVQQPWGAEAERPGEVVSDDDGIDWSADQGKPDAGTDRRNIAAGVREDVSDAMRAGLSKRNVARGTGASSEGILAGSEPERTSPEDGWREWPVEPGICRVAYGVPRRVDRLRGLGNAVVPKIPEMIGWFILAAERARIDAARAQV